MNVFKMPDWRLGLALVGSTLLISAASAAEPVKPASPAVTSGLVQYQTPEGVSYAAVVLPAPAAPSVAATPHDHVVLIDTSASQSGDFRSRSIAMAGAVCRALPAGDRVRLIAADVTASSLTDGFVLVGSRQLQAGFDKLEDRVPLGSTNMEVALRTALQSFSGTRARSVLYVGDGYSAAQLIQSTAMGKLLADMRAAAVTVNSFAVGPRIDLILLGTLAQHTGGVVVIDEPTLVADGSNQPPALTETAREISRALVAPVFYPERIATSPKISTFYPQTLPPVRFDRETVLLGKDLTTSKLQVKLTGTLNGQAKEYSWTVASEAVSGSAGFVGQAWALAEGSNGLAMPWAGRKLMNQAQQAFDAHLDALAQAGVRSLNAKNVRQVEEIAKTLQQLDANSRDAADLLKASRRLQAKPVKQQLVLAQAEEKPDAEEKPATEKPAATEEPAEEKPTTEKPAGEEKPAPEVGVEEKPTAAVDQLNDTEDKSNPKSGSLLEDLEARRKVREEQITIDVNVAIQDAQAGARDSFPDAYDILKRQLDTVIAATDISADVRQALRKRVENAIQQLQNESESFEQKRAALDRQLSQQEAMKKLMDQTQRDEEKMEQLIDRVRALLIRGYKGNPQAFEDAEAVSRVAVELDPYLGVPNLDVFNSEAAGHLDKARRLRSERQDKLLALLYQVELSHVPFPDEPPIVWPSPERWQWITENRRKWKSVDLKSYSKKEEKIVRELDKPTTFDFTDESLEGVRDTIVERHGFDIVIDKVKLEEESVATDATDITLKVSEISLKNALKLLLDSKNLTYVIENEVMKITTKTDGIAKRPLRVYNVGDLVMPINPLFGMGGSRSGGQTGGGGQFNGGQQGGGMGGGGGGMGGGFGGGANGIGGGVFCIPPFKIPAKYLRAPAADDAQTAVQPAAAGEAFAQAQEPKGSTLNGATLKNRKKKQ